jgi:hypothetical protein
MDVRQNAPNRALSSFSVYQTGLEFLLPPRTAARHGRLVPLGRNGMERRGTKHPRAMWAAFRVRGGGNDHRAAFRPRDLLTQQLGSSFPSAKLAA